MATSRARADERWLLAVSRMLSTAVRSARHPRLYRRIGAAAGVGIAEHLYTTFNRIAEYQPVRMSELPAVMDVDRSTVSRQVAELESAGLVRRVPDADDRRSFILILTKEGRTALDRVWEAWTAAMEHATLDWTAQDRRDFARLFDRFSSALEDYVWADSDDRPQHPERDDRWP